MSATISFRPDFDASQLRGLTRKTKHGAQGQRLLALPAIHDGAARRARLREDRRRRVHKR